VVKELRYKSKGPGIDSRCQRVFSVASDSSMCPGVNSASKNEYQGNPGGKGGPVLKADNLPPSCADVKKSGGLKLLEPCGPVQACNGTALTPRHTGAELPLSTNCVAL
jgi:hypothetical protein